MVSCADCLAEQELKRADFVATVQLATQVVALGIQPWRMDGLPETLQFIYGCGEFAQRDVGKFFFQCLILFKLKK